MRRACFYLRLAVPLWAVFCSAAQESIEVPNIEYLGGVPGHSVKRRGLLRIGPSEIAFLAQGEPQFTIGPESVTYVAAQAQVAMRARTADVGAATVSVAAAAVAAATVFPAITPFVFLFHKREKHLLSIEYLEGGSQIRRLALFDVHDHSASAVKKMIDDRLGLTAEFYREKDTQEENRKRQAEMTAIPAGYWETSQNAVVGDVQYDRYLMEPGRYAILIFDRYIGFRPEGMEWAKYRIPVRQRRPDRSRVQELVPIFMSSRLVGFSYNGIRHEFY